MKIAVVGTGISGLVAAHLLHRDHELIVYEAGEHVGGHTNTIEIEEDGQRLAVDTGFIVYNERTYPNFCRLLAQLDVATQPSDMSFSVRDERSGLEYRGDNLNTLFAQRRNEGGCDTFTAEGGCAIWRVACFAACDFRESRRQQE